MIFRKISLIIHAVINILMHIPVFILTSFWGMFIIAVFRLDTITEPIWYIVCLLPLLIPPISCVWGIIRGALNFKKAKEAKLCLFLSIAGMFIYTGMICLAGWLGSIG